MTKLLTSSWMTVVISALLYLGSTVLFWKTPTIPPVAEAAISETVGTGPSWEFRNPEADQLIAELKVEKQSLDKKEQQLNELAVRLQAERAELNQATQSVHQLQADFDQNVTRVREEETANLKKLAKVYSAMSADAAANILGDLDDTTVVKIMVFMKDADTAAIFESMAKKGKADAKRAADLSERLRLATVPKPSA